MRLRYFNQTGDTIVEVLIAVVIVSVVLTGAFVSSNHNIKAIRQAQEHTEALKYAESQLEQLQSASANPATNIFSIAAPTFCMSAGSPNATAGSCSITNGITYTVEDSRTGSGPYDFTSTVTWASVDGSGTDRVSLTYKLNR